MWLREIHGPLVVLIFCMNYRVQWKDMWSSRLACMHQTNLNTQQLMLAPQNLLLISLPLTIRMHILDGRYIMLLYRPIKNTEQHLQLLTEEYKKSKKICSHKLIFSNGKIHADINFINPYPHAKICARTRNLLRVGNGAYTPYLGM